MFLSYGMSSRSQLSRPVTGPKESELSVANPKSGLEDPKKTDRSPYRPPHLRKRDSSKQIGARNSQGLSDQESSILDFTSSDSDYSDSDGSLKDTESNQKSKVRVAAIVCIQVLDESLCAISGFKRTEDPLDDKLLDAPFTSDCIRMKKVSSAPSYELENFENTRDELTSCQSGIEQWC